jgi:dTMP kinase
MTRPARFISFEGGEGAGKTTLINSLSKALQDAGRAVVVTREPGATPLGEKLRELLLDKSVYFPITPMAELLLFLCDRAQHIEQVIKPALAKDRIVLCDRFNDSTIAYQGGARGLGMEKIQSLCEGVCGETRPDITFFLDVDPAIGLNRAKGQQRVLDRMEQEHLDFHNKVRAAFLMLARQDPGRIVVLDAAQSPDAILNQALQILDERT